LSDGGAAYLGAVGDAHRRKFGQFFTPPPVAAFMVRWVLAGGASKIFDPAVGLGAFVRAAHMESAHMGCDGLNNCGKHVNVSGMEIDPVVLKYFHAQCNPESNSESVAVDLSDYLESWGRQHPAIVCNPPYLRFHEFQNRECVRARFKRHLGISLSGYTNAASAFLLKSIAELPEGGRLAYIMPLEFLNTGYGSVVKQHLLDSGSLKAIIRIEGEKDVFPDAVTSVGVLLAARESLRASIDFYSIDRLHDLGKVLATTPVCRVSPDDLRPQDKWLKYFERNMVTVMEQHLVPLQSYGHFSRGIVTGANGFFVLRQSEAAQMRLPRKVLKACVPRSSHVSSCIFGPEDFDRLVATDASVWLLDAKDSMDESVRRYIDFGEQNGYHTRYLAKMRKPWYRMEVRQPAPLWFGVFSRGSFKVIRNYTDAMNLTCYHGFHPNLFGGKYVDRLFLYLKSSAARSILGLSMRRYGDGLNKFEPNDLNNALAPSAAWLDTLPQEVVVDALNACRACGNLPIWADQLFNPLLGIRTGAENATREQPKTALDAARMKPHAIL